MGNTTIMIPIPWNVPRIAIELLPKPLGASDDEAVLLFALRCMKLIGRLARATCMVAEGVQPRNSLAYALALDRIQPANMKSYQGKISLTSLHYVTSMIFVI
jgi:hypothetical protein